MTKKRPETVQFHTASVLENTGFLKLTSKPLTGHSNSSQGKYHQIKNADFMRYSTASVSSNVTLFILFSKTLVAN